MKVTTLVIINDGERVLLGLKKRGFGQGRWNRMRLGGRLVYGAPAPRAGQYGQVSNLKLLQIWFLQAFGCDVGFGAGIRVVRAPSAKAAHPSHN